MDLVHSIIGNPDFGAALAQLIAIILTAVASFVGLGVSRFLRDHATVQQINVLRAAAMIAVQAVEQTMLHEASQAKKAQAIAIVQAYLDQTGVKGFSVAQVESAVEAAVYDALGQLLPAVTLDQTSPPAPQPAPLTPEAAPVG